jgi:Ulp1 family protease
LLSCDLPRQHGVADCGLFAIAYATAINEDKNPQTLVFQQISMRNEFNNMVQNGQLKQFTNYEIRKDVTYREIIVALSTVELELN